MSFISVADHERQSVLNGEFWPDIDCNAARDVMRIDGTVTDARLRMALIEAITFVNQDLASFRLTHQKQGIQKLSDIPSDQIDGVSSYLHYYQNAVYCFATAILSERYRSYDTTWEGHQRSNSNELPIDQLKQQARRAIRHILGIPLCTIELI